MVGKLDWRVIWSEAVSAKFSIPSPQLFMYILFCLSSFGFWRFSSDQGSNNRIHYRQAFSGDSQIFGWALGG